MRPGNGKSFVPGCGEAVIGHRLDWIYVDQGGRKLEGL